MLYNKTETFVISSMTNYGVRVRKKHGIRIKKEL